MSPKWKSMLLSFPASEDPASWNWWQALLSGFEKARFCKYGRSQRLPTQDLGRLFKYRYDQDNKAPDDEAAGFVVKKWW